MSCTVAASGVSIDVAARCGEPTSSVLFRGAGVVVTDFEGDTLPRPVPVHDLPQAGPHVTLLFMRAGALSITGGAQARPVLATPARVVLFGRRGALSGIPLTAARLAGTTITISLATADARATLPAIDALTASPELLLRLQRLRQALLHASDSDPGLDTLAEREAFALLDLALAARARERATRPRGARFAQHRALSDRACALMAAAPDAPHRLPDIARTLAVSPFHLARTFRAHVGIPMHQYLLRVRLARALDEIAGGERSLSALAIRLGFASHSHFTATFRRTFGVSPTRFREEVSGATLHASSHTSATAETRQSA